MYSLDIETLTNVLRGLKVRGSAQAKLPSGIVGVSGQCTVVVVLDEGKMLSITIYDQQGNPLFQGKDAFETIRQRVLTWQLNEASSGPSRNPFSSPSMPAEPTAYALIPQPPMMEQHSASLAALGTFIPVRQQHLSLPPLHWSRTRRRVYALVNGTNDIAYIARLLSLPVGVVVAELQALQGERMVLVRSPQ